MSISRYNWTHKKWCRPSDPINLLFQGISLDEIGEFLVDQGWKSIASSLFSDQVLPYPDPFHKTPQKRQFVGPGKFCLLRRCHLRFWEIGNNILGAIHHDYLRVTGHTSTDFESIEKFFADECSKNPDWEVLMDHVDMDNRICGYGQPYNNGKATLIRRKRP